MNLKEFSKNGASETILREIPGEKAKGPVEHKQIFHSSYDELFKFVFEPENLSTGKYKEIRKHTVDCLSCRKLVGKIQETQKRQVPDRFWAGIFGLIFPGQPTTSKNSALLFDFLKPSGSMARLVAKAAIWAIALGGPVVISFFTQNLQSPLKEVVTNHPDSPSGIPYSPPPIAPPPKADPVSLGVQTPVQPKKDKPHTRSTQGRHSTKATPGQENGVRRYLEMRDAEVASLNLNEFKQFYATQASQKVTLVNRREEADEILEITAKRSTNGVGVQLKLINGKTGNLVAYTSGNGENYQAAVQDGLVKLLSTETNK